MAATAGILTDSISSTSSNPTIYYSASYIAERASENTTAVSITLDFFEWQSTSQNQIPAGSKLTIFARVNGGEWHSSVLKNNFVNWNKDSKHVTQIKLKAKSKSNWVNIDFYVSRSGSVASDRAGSLGTEKEPCKFLISIPNYSRSSKSPTGCIYFKESKKWKKANPYIKIDGVWKKAEPYIKINGKWEFT